MKWHSISEVAKIVNQSRQAVYKRLTRLTLEEKTNLGENLVKDGRLLLSDEGVKRLFDLTTTVNQVDTPVVKTVDQVDTEVVTSLRDQLAAKEKEVVRLDDILGKILDQLESERRLRGEERQRTDTILMKTMNDISTLQKTLEYKKPDMSPAPAVSASRINPRKEDSPRRSAPAISNQVEKKDPIQRELSFLESLQITLNDVSGFLFGCG